MTSTLQKAKVITDRVRRIITITADTGLISLTKQEKRRTKMTKKELEKKVEKLDYITDELERIENDLYEMYKKRLARKSSEAKTAEKYWIAVYMLKEHLLSDVPFDLLDD